VSEKGFSGIRIEEAELILREGVYIGKRYLLCSVYRWVDFEKNEIRVKILAFDNEAGVEHSIELSYEDLLGMSGHNTAFLEDKIALASFLSNGLAYFNNGDNEMLVFENRLYFGDYTGHFGSVEKKSSTEVANSLLLSTHRKRDKLLYEDVGTETELEMNVIHEAFDLVFKQNVYAYN
jgi:hypothetical protein